MEPQISTLNDSHSNVDKIHFFRETMRCLTGNANFQEAFIDVFRFLQTHLPIIGISFEHFLPAEGRLKLLYLITDDGFFELNTSVLLTNEDTKYLSDASNHRIIMCLEDSDKEIIAQKHMIAMKKYIPEFRRSYLVSPLYNGNQVMGYLNFVGNAPHCFTNYHKSLFELILPSFSLMLVNKMHLSEMLESGRKTEEEKLELEITLKRLTRYTIIGANSGLKGVFDSIHQLKNSDAPVILLGETGTGKEVVANVIQDLSSRSNKPFVKVNCGAIPETLLDSELFGHARGAFTGAENGRPGRFEQANGGTLFLDEVGELSPQAQTRLLRVLQDGLVDRIGGLKPIQVDVRIIAATNRDLNQMRQQGKFREDLFHRLHVFPIHLPPLRQRAADIPLMLKYFAENACKRMGIPCPPIHEESLPPLMAYSWPGNARELENLVERALILNPEKPVNVARFLPSARSYFSETQNEHDHESSVEAAVQRALAKLQLHPVSPLTHADGRPKTLDDVVTMHISQTLRYCNGKIYGPNGAAELLGVNHNTLRARIKKLGLDG